MKKILAMVLVVMAIATMFTGCAEVVSEETVTLTVIAEYEGVGAERYYTGNGYQYRSTPAKYNVVLDGKSYSVSQDQGADLVAEYDGCELEGTFIKKTYDNGKVRYELVSVSVQKDK